MIDKEEKNIDLSEILERFYNKTIDEIYVESTEEIDVGNPVGDEQWELLKWDIRFGDAEEQLKGWKNSERYRQK